MTAICVRREKAALSSGCKSHPANAPAGSNRSSHRGNEMAEGTSVQDRRRTLRRTWRLGNLSTPNEVQKLPMASHAKDGVRSCPRAGCGKSACPVVCPAKAGMFSRRKACRGKSQKPRSLDSRVAGNQDSEAYRQRLPREDDESPGRNDSERKSGLESE